MGYVIRRDTAWANYFLYLTADYKDETEGELWLPDITKAWFFESKDMAHEVVVERLVNCELVEVKDKPVSCRYVIRRETSWDKRFLYLTPDHQDETEGELWLPDVSKAWFFESKDTAYGVVNERLIDCEVFEVLEFKDKPVTHE
jgi:hypothetical protein